MSQFGVRSKVREYNNAGGLLSPVQFDSVQFIECIVSYRRGRLNRDNGIFKEALTARQKYS